MRVGYSKIKISKKIVTEDTHRNNECLFYGSTALRIKNIEVEADNCYESNQSLPGVMQRG